MDTIIELAKNKIAKNTSVLILAQVSTRLIGIFYIAALARYLGPSGIGKIATAVALNSLLVLVVGPGLNTLLVRDIAADRQKATKYVSNMIFLKGLLSFPFVILVVTVAQIVGYPADTITIIQLYIIVYLIDQLNYIIVSVFQAFEHMEYEAVTLVLRDLINISLSLLAIYLRLSIFVIVTVSVIAYASRLLSAATIAYRRFISLQPSIDLKMSKTLFISSLPFGVFTILASLNPQLGTFFISLFHLDNIVGIYSAASTLMSTVLFLPNAFSLAIFPTFSNLYAHAQHDLKHFYQLSYKYLLVMGFPLGLGVMLFSEKIISLIYGSQFQSSGFILRILAIFFFTLVGYSNGPLLNAAGKQRFLAWTEGLKTVANGALCLVLVPKWGPAAAAVAFVAPGIATFFVHSIASHRLFGLSLPWLLIGKVFLATLFMGLLTLIALRLGLPWLLAAFIVAPSVYGLTILLLGIVRSDDMHILAQASGSSSIAN